MDHIVDQNKVVTVKLEFVVKIEDYRIVFVNV